MNDKLICPFCEQELKYDGWNEVYMCRNPNCKHLLGFGTKELWQVLIDTKKKLDVAMDGLKRIEKLTEPSYTNRNLEALALAINTFSGEIIEQIKDKEQQ